MTISMVMLRASVGNRSAMAKRTPDPLVKPRMTPVTSTQSAATTVTDAVSGRQPRTAASAAAVSGARMGSTSRKLISRAAPDGAQIELLLHEIEIGFGGVAGFFLDAQ